MQCMHDSLFISSRHQVRVVNKLLYSAGLLLDKTHSWTAVFGMAAAVYAVGYAGFALYGSAEQEFD